MRLAIIAALAATLSVSWADTDCTTVDWAQCTLTNENGGEVGCAGCNNDYDILQFLTHCFANDLGTLDARVDGNAYKSCSLVSYQLPTVGVSCDRGDNTFESQTVDLSQYITWEDSKLSCFSQTWDDPQY